MKPVADQVHNVDDVLITSIDQNMCGALCKCNDAAAWTSQSEADLNKWKRTKAAVDTTPGADPLKDTNGNYYIVTTSNNDGVDTYYECIVSMTVSALLTGNENPMTEGLESALKIMNYFESSKIFS